MQSLMVIRVPKRKVYFGFLWWLKSIGIKSTMRLILMKIFRRSFKFRIEAIMKQICNLSDYSRTSLGLD